MGDTIDKPASGDFDQVILGACNPALAHEGLAEEIELGALRPRDVSGYETDDGDVTVSAVDPQRLVGIAVNDGSDSIAPAARDRSERVLSTVGNESR